MKLLDEAIKEELKYKFYKDSEVQVQINRYKKQSLCIEHKKNSKKISRKLFKINFVLFFLLKSLRLQLYSF